MTQIAMKKRASKKRGWGESKRPMKGEGRTGMTRKNNTGKEGARDGCKGRGQNQLAPMHLLRGWAEAPIKIARTTLIELDGNWSSNTLPLSVTGSVIAPSARMPRVFTVLLKIARSWRWVEPVAAHTQLHRFAQMRKYLLVVMWLPRRVRGIWQCATPVQRVRASEQAREHASPKKNTCDKQVSSWRHISCHTDKNRYYT